MSSRYDWICNSEDRPHYDYDGLYPIGFFYPMRTPEVTTINVINKTEVIVQATEEQVREVMDSYAPELKEDILNDVNDIVADAIDDIDEVDGGSAANAPRRGW